MIGVFGLLALAAIGYGVYFIMVGRFYISTDDAYVRANNTTLGARVSGHVAAILPRDNSIVRAGDVIFRIDDGDYRIAVDAARAGSRPSRPPSIASAARSRRCESAVEQAKAQLASAEAALKRAGLDFDRQQALSTKGFASRAAFEVSEAGRDQGAAAVKSAQAAFDAARDNVEVTKAQQAEARAQLAELQSQLAKAERDLAFTRCARRSTAPSPTASSIPAISSRPGSGSPMSCRSTTSSSTPTTRKPSSSAIRPGQPVNISVDAYGHRKFAGIVDSISPAAGSVFTLLPPDNATGNFTKIVQRLPVRIRVPKDVAKQNLLRAGMSVYVTVDTREGAADADSEADLDAPGTVQPK